MSCCIENLNTLDPQYSISVFPLLIKVLLAPLFQNFQLLSETTLSCSFLVGVHFAKLIMLAASFVCTLLSSLISLWTGSFENIVLFSAVLNRLRLSHLWFMALILNHWYLFSFHRNFFLLATWLESWKHNLF